MVQRATHADAAAVVTEERFNLGCAHFAGVSEVVEANESTNPHHMRLLGTHAAVLVADAVADLVEQSRRSGRRWDGSESFGVGVHIGKKDYAGRFLDESYSLLAVDGFR